MEDICDWPTDMAISVQPDGDSWMVKVMQEGSGDDADIVAKWSSRSLRGSKLNMI
jgi:hypothetical protein